MKLIFGLVAAGLGWLFLSREVPAKKTCRGCPFNGAMTDQEVREACEGPPQNTSGMLCHESQTLDGTLEYDTLCKGFNRNLAIFLNNKKHERN